MSNLMTTMHHPESNNQTTTETTDEYMPKGKKTRDMLSGKQNQGINRQ